MSEYACDWCEAAFKDNAEIYVGDNGIYCNIDCYSEWYLEVCGPGYHTTLSEYKEGINRLEKILNESSRTIKVKCYGKKIKI